MAAGPKAKILVAVVHDNKDRIGRLLEGHELMFVNTCDEARSLLEAEKFGLVLLGVHFDESQMFSLLADIRAHAKYRKVPILCVLGAWGRMLFGSGDRGHGSCRQGDDGQWLSQPAAFP